MIVLDRIRDFYFKWFKSWYLTGYHWSMRKRQEKYEKRLMNDEKPR